jgi:hypothetical protein
MADNTIEQRLERIEAEMANLVTHDELVREFDRIATNIRDLRSELRTRFDTVATRFDAIETRFDVLYAELRKLTEVLRRWPDLFAGLTDRIRRLEDGDPQ